MNSRFSRFLTLAAVLGVVVFSQAGFGQAQAQNQTKSGPPPGSTPLAITDAEVKSLSSSYKDGTILQVEAHSIEQEIEKQNILLKDKHNEQAQWLNYFKVQLEAVKTAHGWGKDVIFDPDTLGYYRLPAVSAPSGPGPTSKAVTTKKPDSLPPAKPAASPEPSPAPPAK